jgi:hypothetical protein
MIDRLISFTGRFSVRIAGRLAPTQTVRRMRATVGTRRCRTIEAGTGALTDCSRSLVSIAFASWSERESLR